MKELRIKINSLDFENKFLKNEIAGLNTQKEETKLLIEKVTK
jgi:hypothetical protein